jgi:hypothetical protein
MGGPNVAITTAMVSSSQCRAPHVSSPIAIPPTLLLILFLPHSLAASP